MNIFSFIFTFRSVLLFLIFLFQNDGIVISHNIPSSIKPGESVKVEFRIKKSGVTGFAKFNLDLPEGFIIKEIDNAGSSFTQQGTIAKWVWTVLPSGEEMVLKFNMTVGSDVQGTKNIGGKFSYILNNEKAVKEMEMHTIQVGEVSTALTENQKEKEQDKISSPMENNQSATKDTLSNAQNYSEPLSQPEITRKVEKISDLEYRIYLTINKGKNISGFAKFSDNLPENMNARAMQTDGASFSIADYRVKFVWVNVPEKEVLNISYVLTGKPSDADFLLGEWVYLENDQSKKVTLTKWTWKDAPQQTNLADKNTNNQNSELSRAEKQEDNKITEVNQKNENNTNQEVVNTAEMKPKNEQNTSSNAKSGNALVVFKVQVGAFRTPVQSPAVFAKNRSLGQTPITEMADGYTKYIIGKYGEYKSARDKRESVRTTVPGAFVVAYNGPTRITVQEALMISNQQWIR